MQRFNINWTAKALVNQMKKGKVNYDNAVQRNLVWDAEKKSLLIHSMIYGYAIPAMYFTRDEMPDFDRVVGQWHQGEITAVDEAMRVLHMSKTTICRRVKQSTEI